MFDLPRVHSSLLIVALAGVLAGCPDDEWKDYAYPCNAGQPPSLEVGLFDASEETFEARSSTQDFALAEGSVGAQGGGSGPWTGVDLLAVGHLMSPNRVTIEFRDADSNSLKASFDEEDHPFECVDQLGLVSRNPISFNEDFIDLLGAEVLLKVDVSFGDDSYTQEFSGSLQ